MNETFADTFYYLALLNSRDAAHQRALEVTAQRSGKLVKTHWILMEVAAAMATPGNRQRFSNLLKTLEADPSTILIPAVAKLFREGAALFESGPDKPWSLTDCISFVVMDRRNIKEALSADHHFAQAGFTLLLG